MIGSSSSSVLFIRSRPVRDGSEFLVICGTTRQVLGGPFDKLAQALGCALSHVAGAEKRVMYDARDGRGREIGGPMLLWPALSNSSA